MPRTKSDRLAVKTLDQRFRYELETGFEMAPRIAQGILEAAKSAFSLDAVSGHQNGRLRPGQIRQVIAAAGSPHGRSLRETEMVEVIWTIKGGEEDEEVLEVLKEQGAQALRRVRILRLADEAFAQGGVPTQEDLGKALGVTARTIRSDVAALEADGYRVATRGKRQGVGRGQTHKVIIVDLYLKRYTYTDTKMRTRHSAPAIKRYIRTFGLVVMLRRKGLSVGEIAVAVGISEQLTEEYLDLYNRYNTIEYRTRLAEMVQMVSGGPQTCGQGSKRGAR